VENTITMTEVSLAVNLFITAGCDEIRTGMFNALNREGIPWLSRVCQVALRSETVPRDWQIG